MTYVGCSLVTFEAIGCDKLQPASQVKQDSIGSQYACFTKSYLNLGTRRMTNDKMTAPA